MQLPRHTSNLSDEEVVALCTEKSYWQHFCYDLSINPSLMTGFRKRIAEANCEFVVGLTVDAGLVTGTVAMVLLNLVNVDTTAQDKLSRFPPDARLLHKARVALVRLARKTGVGSSPLRNRAGYPYRASPRIHEAVVHGRQPKLKACGSLA